VNEGEKERKGTNEEIEKIFTRIIGSRIKRHKMEYRERERERERERMERKQIVPRNERERRSQMYQMKTVHTELERKGEGIIQLAVSYKKV